MEVLVTGATGYLGRELALYLARSGKTVNILVRNVNSPYVPKHPNIHPFAGDILDPGSVKVAIKNCRGVFHTAAIVKVASREIYQTNVNGTKNILDAAIAEGVEKFVYTSTCAVLGSFIKEPVTENDPRITCFTNDYELSKSISEKLVMDYNCPQFKTMIATVSKIFGPGVDRRSPSMLTMIGNVISNRLIFIPSPASIMSNFVFIEDAVKGHDLVMQLGTGGEKYILGGENISYEGFFNLAAAVIGKKAHLVPVKRNIATCATGICEFFLKLSGKDPFVTAKGVAEMYKPKVFSSQKAVTRLGYAITPLDEALLKTLRFLNNNSYGTENVHPHYRCE